MKNKIQFKLNDRVFLVELNTKGKEYDEIMNEAQEKLIQQIQANNETIHNIFFECLEVVCSECGVSLTNGEEDDATKCLQCEALEVEDE